MSCSMLSHAVDVKDIKCDLIGYSVMLKEGDFERKGISLELSLTAPKGTILTPDFSKDTLRASSHATDFAKNSFDGSITSVRAVESYAGKYTQQAVDLFVSFDRADPSRPLWVKDSIQVFAAGGLRPSKLMPLDLAKGGSLTVEQMKIDYKKADDMGSAGIELSFKKKPANFHAFEFYDAQGKQIEYNSSMSSSGFLGYESSYSFDEKLPAALKVIMLKDNKKLSIPVDIKINLGGTATGQ